MKKETYESPKMVFIKTELYENVAAECWAKPSLYCLVDPTDDDNCGGNMKYADLAGFPIESQNGCNKETKAALKGYLKEIYGPNSGNGHFLSDDDITMIMNSGGGNEGTSLHESQYIDQVRS